MWAGKCWMWLPLSLHRITEISNCGRFGYFYKILRVFVLDAVVQDVFIVHEESLQPPSLCNGAFPFWQGTHCSMSELFFIHWTLYWEYIAWKHLYDYWCIFCPADTGDHQIKGGSMKGKFKGNKWMLESYNFTTASRCKEQGLLYKYSQHLALLPRFFPPVAS